MDPQKSAPPSPDPGDVDPLPPEVAALGLRISRSLKADDDQDDPASTWISMRIAELIREAANAATTDARRAAAEQCQDLVFAAWDRRRSWPRGWPPRSVMEVTSALERATSPASAPRRRRVILTTNWAGQLAEATQNLQREQQIWILLALRELDPDNLQPWLTDLHEDQDQGECLDEAERDDPSEEADEAATLRNLVTHTRNAEDALRRLLPRPRTASTDEDARTPEDITRAAVVELRRLHKARLDQIRCILAVKPSALT